jgi:DnaJ-class molecular chaperone
MDMKTCTTCQGAGTITVQVVTPEEEPPAEVTCPRCGGTGEVPA